VPADLPPMAWSPPSERETPAFVDFESAEAEAGIRYSKYRGHRLADRPLVDREGARAIRMDPNAVKAFLYCGVDDSYVFYRRVRNRVEITVVGWRRRSVFIKRVSVKILPADERATPQRLP